MVTIAVDISADQFNGKLIKGEDAKDIFPTIAGIKPDKLIVHQVSGPGGGHPECLATFNDERKARSWFAIVTDDADPDWFDENVVD